MVILNQSKPISLILKIEKLKIQKSKICKFPSIFHKHGNMSTHSKSNSTSFMFNNIFCEMNI